MRSHTLDLISK